MRNENQSQFINGIQVRHTISYIYLVYIGGTILIGVLLDNLFIIIGKSYTVWCNTTSENQAYHNKLYRYKKYT